ncbi:MAG: hypothetical protein AAFU85_23400, partial [Planctomycetota bacterium]
TSDLADHCRWAIQGGLYPVVIALYKRNLHPFGRNAGLSYSVAQAFAETGQSDQAEQRAQHAFGLNPFPPKQEDAGDGEEQTVDRQTIEIGEAHLEVGRQLYQRGCYEWYDRELRQVMEYCGIESMTGVRARNEMSFSLAERLLFDQVVEVLSPIVDRMEKDAQYSQRLLRNQIFVNRLLSSFHYAQGIVALDSEGEFSEAKRLLKLSYREDPRNIDILIKMFHVKDPADSEWGRYVSNQIAQDVSRRKRKIGQYEVEFKRSRDGRFLAEELNQYAWLVSNTEGDFEDALKSSLRSLELTDDAHPDEQSARLDTCARCYYSLDRVDEAIETQREAVALMPHSPPMLRQLAEFEAKQAESGSAPEGS